jgi:glycosyltransferase involved in cell wall biosynthesis
VILYSNLPLEGDLGDLPPGWTARVLRWPLSKMWSQTRLAMEILFHPPDIFFAPGQLAPWLCPKKTAAVVHDSAFRAYPEAYRFWGRQYLKCMNRLLAKKAQIIITPSDFSKNELIKYYRINPEKIFVLPLGYNEAVFKKSDDAVKIADVLARLKIKTPFIMSLGRLEEKKNTAAIIKAFDVLKQEGKNRELQLVLAGAPGVGFEKINNTIDSSPNKNDIILAGWITDEDSALLFNAAEVFVFPSWYEGFGIPVLESMACGCPCVLSDRGSLPEAGGGAALYANPAEPAEIARQTGRILNESGLKQKLSDAGRERVKSFSWRKHAQSVWQHLQNLSESK